MYHLGDTIAAISSPSADGRVILRVSGPQAVPALNKLFKSIFDFSRSHIANKKIQLDSQLKVDAKIYFFRSPHSYTGEDVAELHLYSNRSVTEKLMEMLFKTGIRQAGPGEFTARAFFCGKIDLAQAEAVNQIITASNKYQIESAENLLGGRLMQITERVCSELIDCLSLLEASMDFSDQEIEIISPAQAQRRLKAAKKTLEDLLKGIVTYQETSSLPSVAIAGAPNAGKSRLFNSLLGKKRSIVSSIRKTTRDVVTGELTIGNSRCVLFDCAGLMKNPLNIIDKLAQTAAIEGMKHSQVIIFCVDISKPLEDLKEDLQIRNMLQKDFLLVATKADLLIKREVSGKLRLLEKIFDTNFLAVSAKTNIGIENLRKKIQEKILDLFFGRRANHKKSSAAGEWAFLTIRHRQALGEAAEYIAQAAVALKSDSPEAAAVFLRTAIGLLEQVNRPLDEVILDKIFRQFCVGK